MGDCAIFPDDLLCSARKRFSTLSAFLEAFLPVAAIFRDRPRGPDVVVGDEAREAPLSDK